MQQTSEVKGESHCPVLFFNVLVIVWLFRLILRVLSQYQADCKVVMVGLRALALLLRSGT